MRDQLLEMGTQQLAFTHQEAKQFFDCRSAAPMEQQDSSRLCDEVEGWATALQLIALSARQSASSAQLSAKRLAGLNASHLCDYLVDEVLDHVDADARAFLLRCSVLRSMNDALIVRLTGEDNGQQRLEELERQGLFIHRMDDTGEWFNFHPLFASFPAPALPVGTGAGAAGCTAPPPRAGWRWGIRRGHSPRVGGQRRQHAARYPAATRLVAVPPQRTGPAGGVLNALPYERLIQNPKLALLQAWLAQSQHRYSEVNTLLERAERTMREQKIEIDQTLHAEFDALRAQVAINAGKPEEAERLATEALKFLPLSSYYSRIVATSVTGEVHHCKGELARALPMMQQTEQMARRHQANHYALWALLQQSEILIAQGYLQAAYETQDKAFELIREQHLEQLPMHEFLLRIRAQILWSWSRLDEAEDAARAGLKILANYQPQQQLQCIAMLAKCSLARGDLDNANTHLQRCEALLHGAHYHRDWLTNTDKSRVIHWQMTGDTAAAAQWLRHTEKPGMADNHFTQGQWRNIARVQILLGQYEEAGVVLDELNENARRLRLVSDLNRNLLLSNQLYWLRSARVKQQALIEALSLANRTGFISHFVIEGEAMAQQLRQLIQLNTLPELEQHRAQRILRDINQHHRHKFAHFDENFVDKLLTHPRVPELIRTSPLTQREWQVLGLIYSGYSNDQIAGELDVAATTIKTHIRNLYQKLGVAHRQEAVRQAAAVEDDGARRVKT